MIAFFAFATSVAISSAANSVTVTNAQSTGSVVASYHPTTTGGYQWKWTDAETGPRRDLGQTFALSTDTLLESITLKLQSGTGVGAKNANFTLTLFAFEALPPTAEKPATVIKTFHDVFPNTTYTANTYLTFDISSANIVLSGSTTVTYGFLLSFDSGAGSRAISFYSAVNTTESGKRIESANGTTIVVTNTALDYSIQGTAAVPEPATVAAFLGAIVLATSLLIRRRQRS